jgi:hypothetical protein
MESQSTTLHNIEVSNALYLELKNSILNETRFLRVDIDSKELKLKTARSVVIDGNEVRLTRKALNELTSIFGVSQTFYSTVNKSFGEDTELTNALFSAIKGKINTKITFVFNLQSNEIVKIYVAGTKLISDSQYFDTVEKVIANNPGTVLRNIGVQGNGDITMSLINPKMKFQIGNMNEEAFTMGTTLDFVNNELTSSFFTQRLVCSNGMRVTDKLCTRSVKVGKDVPEFMEALKSPEFQIHSMQEFEKRVNRLINTTASLKEVLDTEDRLVGLFGKGVESEILMSRFDARNLRFAFGPEYMMRTDIHQYLKTNISMWDLVNQVTAMSSYIEQNRLLLDARVNTTLQIIGGNILFKNPMLPPNNIRQLYN